MCQHEERGASGEAEENTCRHLLTLGSPGCIHGPVGIIICDPGVAGQAPRHDGVMRPMLAAEFQVPGSGDDAGDQCREGLWG